MNSSILITNERIRSKFLKETVEGSSSRSARLREFFKLCTPFAHIPELELLLRDASKYQQHQRLTIVSHSDEIDLSLAIPKIIEIRKIAQIPQLFAVLLSSNPSPDLSEALQSLSRESTHFTWLPIDDDEGRSADKILNILAVQTVPEIFEKVLASSAEPRTVLAAASLLSSPTPSPGTGSDYPEGKAVLFGILLDAIDLVLSGVSAELANLQEMLEADGKKVELPDSIHAIQEWVQHTASLNRMTPPSVWEKLIALLPRGFEAERKLWFSLNSYRRNRPESTHYEISEQIRALTDKATGLLWKHEAEVVDRLLETTRIALDESKANRQGGSPKSRKLAAVEAFQILAANPFFRRNSALSFLHWVWGKTSIEGHASHQIDRSKTLIISQLELLPKWRSFLGLPPNWATNEEVNEIAQWIEGVTLLPCVKVETTSSSAWLYLEKPFTVLSTEQTLPRKVCNPKGPSDTESSSPCPLCGGSCPLPFLDSLGLGRAKDSSKPPLVCPECGRFNSRDWWVCQNHGKTAEIIPIDKVRCPECILRHHRDPVQFPASSISVRPGYAEPFPCPFCEELFRRHGDHPIFILDEDLIPFYRDGVNGHDRARFLEVARKRQLIDNCRCPHCATILVPVDHRHLDPN